MSAAIIPVFPLNTVLFPGMWLPLHIFEERYKDMLQDCGQGEGVFGVALIREGQEVGGAAEPYSVGTVANIRQTTQLEGGRFFVQTIGVRRFSVVRLLHDRSYLRGEVELFDEKRVRRTPRVKRLMAEATERYKGYLEVIKRIGGQVGTLEESALDPEFLSWLIASTLVVAPPVRQQLLEIPGADERLERELDLISDVRSALEAQIERAESGQRRYPFSLN